jgi:hypothetical protein
MEALLSWSGLVDLAAEADVFEVFPVGVFWKSGNDAIEGLRIEEAHAPSHFLKTANFETLAVFNCRDEVGGFQKGIVGAGIEPGNAATEELHLQLAHLEVSAVDVGDFEFAAFAGFEVSADINDLVVVHIEAGNSVVGFGLGRFFFDGKNVLVGIEFHDAVTLGVGNPVAKDGSTAFVVHGGTEGGELAVEEIIAEDQGDRIVSDKGSANDEGLGDAFGAGLFGVGEIDAKAGAIAKEILKTGEILGSGDEEDIADAGKHEGGEGVVDHGLVINGHELFTGDKREGMEACSGPTGEEDAFFGAGLIRHEEGGKTLIVGCGRGFEGGVGEANFLLR